jgi:hypothetical protein
VLGEVRVFVEGELPEERCDEVLGVLRGQRVADLPERKSQDVTVQGVWTGGATSPDFSVKSCRAR